MIINANTKISKILRQHPGALEAIVSLDPKFSKLRNPLLRKLMAARTSIGMASSIGGFGVERFFEQLAPLGFEIDQMAVAQTENEQPRLPAFFNSLRPGQIMDLDVRPVMDAGGDPLTLIMNQIKKIPRGGALKIINSFEPTPLMVLLKKQGFESFADTIDDQTVETYFYKPATAGPAIPTAVINTSGWEEVLQRFSGKLQTVDVRQMAMPMPMMTILETLDKLPGDTALFVYHKRIPVFLLPELKDRKMDYRIREVRPGEVHLLIFKD